MAMHNDNCESRMMMVEIPLAKYESLIEAAVKIDIIINYINNEKYINTKDIRGILGMPKEDEDE